MPAKAGIHLHYLCCKAKKTWIPACAGTTNRRTLWLITESSTPMDM